MPINVSLGAGGGKCKMVETSEFVDLLLRNFRADKQLTDLEASLVFACFKNVEQPLLLPPKV